MTVYNNNNTIVKVSEFLENPALLIQGTIDRKALLIILDDETMEEVVVIPSIVLEGK